MIFSLDVRRARKGDCLLLHFGTKAKPGLAHDRRRPEGRLRAASEAAPRWRSAQARGLDAQTTRCRSTC